MGRFPRTVLAFLLVAGAALLAASIALAQPSGPEPDPRTDSKTDPKTGLDYAQVRNVVARLASDGTWRFDVTVEHNDEGWDHYADFWDVVHPDTLEAYGERELLHPHDNEQPFTRSQSGIRIPDEGERFEVRR